MIRTVLALAAVLVAASPVGAEPLKIRIGWATMPGHLIPVLYSKREILKHYGTVYTVEAVNFRGSTPQITALAAKELDMVAFAPPSLVLATLNARLDVRAVADIIQDGAPTHYSEQALVKTDAGINAVPDLKGKRIATNAIGSYMDTMVRAMLKKNGLIDKRDYTIIEAPFPTMKAMLQEKKADLIPSVPPFSFDPELKQISRVLFDSKEAIGVSQFIVWAARKSFIDKNRAAMVDFMEDMLIIERWFMDPKNKNEVMQIASKVTKAPPERFDWLFTGKDYYRNPDMLPNLDALQSNINTTKELGFIKSSLDVKKYSDLSLVQEAAKRLK